MDKKALTQLQRIGIGSVLGFSGFIVMSFGSALLSDMLLRIGIVLVTIGGWLVSWK